MGPGRSLVLVGFRGAGKTALGRRLASFYGLPFVDLDRRIEESRHRSVEKMFRESGEERFRDWESAALARALQESPSVLATGGGVVVREANRRLLSAHLCVYLKVPVDVLITRLAGSTRPSLTGLAPDEEVRHLVELREPWYREVSTHVVAVPQGEPEPVTFQRLCDLLGPGPA